MKNDVFDNAENITFQNEISEEEVKAVMKEKEALPLICVGEEKPEDGEVSGYYINEDGQVSFYDKDYLTLLIKTGKRTVKNLKYDQKKLCLVYTGT